MPKTTGSFGSAEASKWSWHAGRTRRLRAPVRTRRARGDGQPEGGGPAPREEGKTFRKKRPDPLPSACVHFSPRSPTSRSAAQPPPAPDARREDPRTRSTGVPVVGGRAAAPHLGSLQQLDDLGLGLGLGVPGRSPARAPPLLLRRRGPRGPGERCGKGR